MSKFQVVMGRQGLVTGKDRPKGEVLAEGELNEGVSLEDVANAIIRGVAVVGRPRAMVQPPVIPPVTLEPLPMNGIMGAMVGASKEAAPGKTGKRRKRG